MSHLDFVSEVVCFNIKVANSFFLFICLCIFLFISLFCVLLHTRENFTYTSAGYCRTFQHRTGEIVMAYHLIDAYFKVLFALSVK